MGSFSRRMAKRRSVPCFSQKSEAMASHSWPSTMCFRRAKRARTSSSPSSWRRSPSTSPPRRRRWHPCGTSRGKRTTRRCPTPTGRRRPARTRAGTGTGTRTRIGTRTRTRTRNKIRRKKRRARARTSRSTPAPSWRATWQSIWANSRSGKIISATLSFETVFMNAPWRARRVRAYFWMFAPSPSASFSLSCSLSLSFSLPFSSPLSLSLSLFLSLSLSLSLPLSLPVSSALVLVLVPILVLVPVPVPALVLAGLLRPVGVGHLCVVRFPRLVPHGCHLRRRGGEVDGLLLQEDGEEEVRALLQPEVGGHGLPLLAVDDVFQAGEEGTDLLFAILLEKEPINLAPTSAK